MDELVEYYEKISLNPSVFKWVNWRFRQAALRKLPFVIIYKTLGNGVHIYALFHTSKRPRKKIRRD